MLILADENIPGLERTFALLGDVRTFNGREPSRAAVAEADILLVRSVTRVDEALLSGSRVRFVGTATIGVDHVDQAFLQGRGIGFASAPGSNARSVAEYVLSCLAALHLRGQVDIARARVGIVGMGNVGSSVYRLLRAVDIACVAYDPLIPQDSYPVLEDWSALSSADVLCLHTPLTSSGPYPTRHLFTRTQLQALAPGTILLNAGRGAVVDNRALRELLAGGAALRVVLDVWEGEPAIDPELLDLCCIGTPHIAGYSHDGKLAATSMLYAAAREWLGLPADTAAEISSAAVPITLDTGGLAGTDHDRLSQLLLRAYDVREDDRRLRESVAAGDIGPAFDHLRRHYPVRREFTCHAVAAANLSERLRRWLAKLGFAEMPA